MVVAKSFFGRYQILHDIHHKMILKIYELSHEIHERIRKDLLHPILMVNYMLKNAFLSIKKCIIVRRNSAKVPNYGMKYHTNETVDNVPCFRGPNLLLKAHQLTSTQK